VHIETIHLRVAFDGFGKSISISYCGREGLLIAEAKPRREGNYLNALQMAEEGQGKAMFLKGELSGKNNFIYPIGPIFE
jgi:hypothetical protein